MDSAADISSGAVRRVGDNYAWFNKMPDSYSGTYRQFSDKVGKEATALFHYVSKK